MKFAEHLSAHITPEWRKQYINYEVRNPNDFHFSSSRVKIVAMMCDSCGSDGGTEHARTPSSKRDTI